MDQRRGDPRRRRRARLGSVAVSLFLHGLGHFHPENEITNQFLEDLDIGTTDAWILERVGIRSRRTLLPLDYIKETSNRDPRMATEVMVYGNAETGRRAAEMAIARAGIDRSGDRNGDLRQLGARHGDAGRRVHDRRRARPRGPLLRRQLRLHELPRGDPPALDDGPREAAAVRAVGRAGGRDANGRLLRPQRGGAVGRRRRRRPSSRRASAAGPRCSAPTLESSPPATTR